MSAALTSKNIAPTLTLIIILSLKHLVNRHCTTGKSLVQDGQTRRLKLGGKYLYAYIRFCASQLKASSRISFPIGTRES